MADYYAVLGVARDASEDDSGSPKGSRVAVVGASYIEAGIELPLWPNIAS